MGDSESINGPKLKDDRGKRKRNAGHVNKADYRSWSDESNNDKYRPDSGIRDKKPKWPRKEFKLQNSYLTEAFKNVDVRCGRHVCYVVGLTWTIRLMVLEYSKNETFQIPGISTLKNALRGIQYWLLSHVIFSILALIPFVGFRIWYRYRRRKLLIKSSCKIFDYTCMLFVILFMSALLLVPWWWILFISDLGPFIKEWIISEQVRIYMKIIAFVSTKVHHALEETDSMDNRAKNKNVTTESAGAGTTLSKFTYFLYAPTLVYSDDYPRNEKIRWSFVLENLIDILIAFYVGFVIFETEVQPSALSYLLNGKPRSYLLLILETSLPFVALLVLMMTAVWHSLQNVFAEILRFGDRRFYSDWWNEGTAGGFHRANNIVVQDWLFYYVYYPVKMRTGSKFGAQMTVLFLSAVVHDVMLALALGFALPLVISNFLMLAVILRSMKKERNKEAFQNLMYLMTFPCGVASMGAFLAAEYFARQVCHRTIESSWDYFYPRFWNCTLIN